MSCLYCCGPLDIVRLATLDDSGPSVVLRLAVHHDGSVLNSDVLSLHWTLTRGSQGGESGPSQETDLHIYSTLTASNQVDNAGDPSYSRFMDVLETSARQSLGSVGRR